jgi:hypothetical protein
MPRAIQIRRTAIISPEFTPPVDPFNQALEVGGFTYFSRQVGQASRRGRIGFDPPRTGA